MSNEKKKNSNKRERKREIEGERERMRSRFKKMSQSIMHNSNIYNVNDKAEEIFVKKSLK